MASSSSHHIKNICVFGGSSPGKEKEFLESANHLQKLDTTKRLMSSPKYRSVEVINNPARPGSNHKEVNCINYK